MVNFATSAAGSIPPSANEVCEASAGGPQNESRRQRIQQLRESIESGQYRVSAHNLADALFRAARQAN
jgi:anti-sigma28 factor (negative regulator of flagellin synthesis)